MGDNSETFGQGEVNQIYLLERTSGGDNHDKDLCQEGR